MTELILYSHMRTLNGTPEYREESWPDLCNKLDTSAKDHCDPMMKNGLKELSDDEYLTRFGFTQSNAKLPSLTSALFKQGNSREIKNVTHLGNLFIADIDHAPISFKDMALILDGMGINYYLYRTTNHTDLDPSYRLLLPLDRDMEVDEYPHLWDAMNYKFGDCFDDKTKDMVRMGFLPRAWGGVQRSSRHAINKPHLGVSDVLTAFPVARPVVASSHGGNANQKATSVTANVVTLKANLSRSSNVNIKDFDRCPYVTESANLAYEEKSGRYFTFMCRVATAALRDRYDIQPAELVSLADKADAAFGVTTKRTGALREAERAIQKSVDYLASNVTPFPSTVTPEDFKPPVVPKATDMVVHYIDAPCGAGKSYAMLQRILNNKGKYIYACDKITTLKERRNEFKKLLNEQYSSDIYRTESAGIFKAQSKPIEDEYGSVEETDDVTNVMQRIATAGFKLNRKFGSGEIDNGVLFITHRAAQMMDWSQFKDYELIIDEVPDVISTFSRSIVKSTMTYIQDNLDVASEDGDTYLMKLHTKGQKFLDSRVHDDVLKSIVGLMRNAADDHTNLWVMKDGWDKATVSSSENDDNQPVTLTFFSLFTPDSMKAFKQVYLLGDELLKSRFRHAWEKIGGVTFLEADFWIGGRPRDFALKKRATIHYFMEKNSSFGRFEGEDDPLNSISAWLVRNTKKPLLYTCNERFKSNTAALQRGLANYITPKAHGLNGLQDFSILVWMAAMRSSGQEYNITRKLINMTAPELDRDKEFNAAYQMVMRGVLRKFDSEEHCDIYVVSKAQAEYLSERLDGCEVKYIPDVVKDAPMKTSNSMRTDDDKKAANAKSSKKYRDKKKKEKEQMEGPKKPADSSTVRSKRSRDKNAQANKTTTNTDIVSSRTGLKISASGLGAR